MYKGNLYLAHPYTRRKEVRIEELKFEEKTGVNLINPFYDISRDDIKLMDAGLKKPRDFKKKSEGLDIINRDLSYLRGSQGTLGVYDKYDFSIGAIMEVFYSSFVLGKPTYLISKSEEVRGHPWIVGLVDKTFIDWKEFTKYSRGGIIEQIKKRFNENIRRG